MMAACAGDYPCSGEIAQQCEVRLVGAEVAGGELGRTD